MNTIYMASKTKHAGRWRDLRDTGVPIKASWIDEAASGEAGPDMPSLWTGNIMEAVNAAAVIVYTEAGERMKGALTEIGAALAAGAPIFWVGPDHDPEGSAYTVAQHELVTRCTSVDEAIGKAMEFVKLEAEQDPPWAFVITDGKTVATLAASPVMNDLIEHGMRPVNESGEVDCAPADGVGLWYWEGKLVTEPEQEPKLVTVMWCHTTISSLLERQRPTGADEVQRPVEDVLVKAGAVPVQLSSWTARDALARAYGITEGERVRGIGPGSQNQGQTVGTEGLDHLVVRWDVGPAAGKTDIRPRRLLLRVDDPGAQDGEWRVTPGRAGALVRLTRPSGSDKVVLVNAAGAAVGVELADIVSMWTMVDRNDVGVCKTEAATLAVMIPEDRESSPQGTGGLWRKSGIKGGKYIVHRRDGTIPHWPYFVLGARDPAAPAALRRYAAEAAANGYDVQYVHDVLVLADEFENYRAENGAGNPDARPFRKDDPATIDLMDEHARGA